MLTTTEKYVADYIIKSGISNYPHGSIHLYMDNPYADPQLFSLMERYYNLRAVGKCRSNRKVFDSEHLMPNKN